MIIRPRERQILFFSLLHSILQIDFSVRMTSTISDTIRNLVAYLFAPFKHEYRQWPWGYMGTIIVVCIGSYTFYRYIPEPYRRYYMSSTSNFSRRYNQALDAEKKKLFNELRTVSIREPANRLHVVEIGAAHGANMSYYPPNRKIILSLFSHLNIVFFR